MALGQPAAAEGSVWTSQAAFPHPPRPVHNSVHAACGWRMRSPQSPPTHPHTYPPSSWIVHPHPPPHLSTNLSGYPHSYPQDVRVEEGCISARFMRGVIHTGPDLSTDFGHLSTFSRSCRLPATALPFSEIMGVGRTTGAGKRLSTVRVDNSPVLWKSARAQRPRRSSSRTRIKSLPSMFAPLPSGPSPQ